MPSPDATIKLLDDLTTRSINLPATAGAATGVANHKFQNGLIHTKITLTAAATLLTAGGAVAIAGGVKVFDFPTGVINVVATRIKGTLNTVGMNSTAGEIGLGTVVASGAVAVFSATATFEDFHEGGVPALSNITAGTGLAFTNVDSLRGCLPAAGTVATAVDMHLNAATTASGAGTMTISSGATIEIWWTWLAP